MQANTSLYCLVYISKIAHGERAQIGQTVRHILAQAKHRNARDGITGLLVFSELFFAQALEGDLRSVEQTFARISKDSRHMLPSVVFKRPINSRSFSGWSMCAHEVTKLETDMLKALEASRAFPPPVGSGVALLDQLKAIGQASHARFDLQTRDENCL